MMFALRKDNLLQKLNALILNNLTLQLITMDQEFEKLENFLIQDNLDDQDDDKVNDDDNQLLLLTLQLQMM